MLVSRGNQLSCAPACICVDELEAMKKKTYSQMLLLETWAQVFSGEDENLSSGCLDTYFFHGLSQFLQEMAKKSNETYEWLNGLSAA